MTPEYARVMARYNRWMNDKVYAVANELTDAERKEDRGAFFGSIHRTLNHLLLADRVWLGRFAGTELQEGEMGPGGIRSLDQELYADFDELRRERTKTDDDVDAFVATLTDDKLRANLRYRRRGAVNEFPLWHAVTPGSRPACMRSVVTWPRWCVWWLNKCVTACQSGNSFTAPRRR